MDRIAKTTISARVSTLAAKTSRHLFWHSWCGTDVAGNSLQSRNGRIVRPVPKVRVGAERLRSTGSATPRSRKENSLWPHLPVEARPVAKYRYQRCSYQPFGRCLQATVAGLLVGSERRAP